MNWTQTEYPDAPWDTPGLPPRRMDERCAHHAHCAYRDDDPERCPRCHRKTNGTVCTHQQGMKASHAADANAGIAMPRQPRPSEIAGCAKCNEKWTGGTVCHCGTCHQNFSSRTAFDKHRIGSYTDPKNPRRCADPATRDLIPTTRPTWTGWALPGERPEEINA